jgi:Ran-interacting Mog1 protein
MSPSATTTTSTTDRYGKTNCNWSQRSLYGGSITCQLPNQFYDLSNIRQVPDHQECYQGIIESTNDNDDPRITFAAQEEDVKVSTSSPSLSLFVMEILELQKDIDHADIVEYLFHDLAESNGCSNVVQNTETTTTTIEQHDQPRIVSFQSDKNDNPMNQILPPKQLLLLTNNESTMDVENNDGTDNVQQNVVYRSGYGVQRIHPGKEHINPSIMQAICIHLFVIRLIPYHTDLLITLTAPFIEEKNSSSMIQQQEHKEIFQKIISSVQIHDVSLFNVNS